MRVCVCTIVHHPEDARILHRQIRALLDAGHEVTYIAPFRACNVTPWPEIAAVDVPRATGRNRVAALRSARKTLAKQARTADVVLVHDPELLLALPDHPAVVWDVHEDTAAALTAKEWLPGPLRRPLRPLVRMMERRAERRVTLLLAEEGYRARFAGDHPVVPNTTFVPAAAPRPPHDRRVVYVGHLSEARGAAEIMALARELRDEGIAVELVGAADESVRPMLRDCQRAGLLRWYGFVPNDRALRVVKGAMAGLSLLHDEPNYRHSLPTKVIEYMAHGVPVITTPIPAATDLVVPGECGIVVPFGDHAAVAAAVRKLHDDPALRVRMGRRGYETARDRFHWPDHAGVFVATLEDLARGRRQSAPRAALSGRVVKPGLARSPDAGRLDLERRADGDRARPPVEPAS
jgi:glycosyltransferase involved in cell wall biosynthesis